jgi:hypothetical protein
MRYRSLALVTALASAVASPGHTQDIAPRPGTLPAVSGLNGKFSLESGIESSFGKAAGVGLASGSITMPLGHAFGLQFDADAATSEGNADGGGTAHLFWRDPAMGLLGLIGSVEGDATGHAGSYGVEGEVFAGPVTLGTSMGYVDTAASVLGQSGGFYEAHVKVYPAPDLSLNAGLETVLGHLSGIASVEYQPTLLQQHNVSFFVDTEAGEQSFYGVTAGIRFYFGADKTLIRRHREDDPETNPVILALQEAAREHANRPPQWPVDYGGFPLHFP